MNGNWIKKPLVSMLALVTVCGMLAGSAMAEEGVEEALVPAPEAQDVPAAAEPEAQDAPAAVEEVVYDPLVGAWKLYQVFEKKDGAESELLPEEENRILYGEGVSIYNFDDSGVSHHISIVEGESIDLTGVWEKTEETLYLYKEDPEVIELRYVPEEGMLHRESQDEGRTLDYVYAKAFIDSWILDKVQLLIEGEAPADLSREDNQSLYGSGESILTFRPDGTAVNVITEGADTAEVQGSWKSDKPNSFVYSEETLSMEYEFTYFSSNDAIFRDVWNDMGHLRFHYKRADAGQEALAAQPQVQAQAQTQPQVQAQAQTQEQSYGDEFVEDDYYEYYEYADVEEYFIIDAGTDTEEQQPQTDEGTDADTPSTEEPQTGEGTDPAAPSTDEPQTDAGADSAGEPQTNEGADAATPSTEDPQADSGADTAPGSEDPLQAGEDTGIDNGVQTDDSEVIQEGSAEDMQSDAG